MESQDLKYLKKHYGENFARLCRELFPTLLETPGLLQGIITKQFDTVPTLYEDILPIKNQFKDWIYSFVREEEKEKEIIQKSPEELMDEAGYILYPECKTKEDIQKFKKYYAPGEELCTFRGERLNYCRVWFAVKKNVNDIKRENFPNPNRQDEYGTSVISIQFTKGKNSTLSIKNRYNHIVDYPDSTFHNNLENIKHGLTNSFCEKYEINFSSNAINNEFLPDVLEGYVAGRDGKFYKSNIELNGKNYCANNYVIKFGQVIHYDPSKFILIDNYLLNLEKKQIHVLEGFKDSFVDGLRDIKNINITYDENKNKVISIIPNNGEEIKITVNNLNQIIGYKNNNLIVINDYFMDFNKKLEKIEIPNVERISNRFLVNNKMLENINLPNVKKIGDNFITYNKKISEINLPNLEITGEYFLFNNEELDHIELPKVKEIGSNFFTCNKKLNNVDLPQVEIIGNRFLYNNTTLTKISLPNVKKIGDDFLANNQVIKQLSLPKIKKNGYYFFEKHENRWEIYDETKKIIEKNTKENQEVL